MSTPRTAIILGISSDIGSSLAEEWMSKGYKVLGTYRKEVKIVNELKTKGAFLTTCNFNKLSSIKSACSEIKKKSKKWDILVFCPASLKPVGLFNQIKAEEWIKSFELNFTNQIAALNMLLSARSKNKLGPCVIFFSGGGVNDAPSHYSAYITSKIATIKICELLDQEIRDARFITIGPGWVNTKIHKETLDARGKAGNNYHHTLKRLKDKNFTTINEVIGCINWVLDLPKKVIGGRNINVVHDAWGNQKFERKLGNNTDLLKLRKYGTI